MVSQLLHLRIIKLIQVLELMLKAISILLTFHLVNMYWRSFLDLLSCYSGMRMENKCSSRFKKMK